MIRETIDTGKVIWQSDRAKTALCPFCFVSIKTQYEGDRAIMLVKCGGPFGIHIVEYESITKEQK